MVILKFRSSDEHEELLMKVKKMKKFTQDLEDCLEEAFDDEVEYRGGYYRHDEEEPRRMESRYARMNRRSRM